MQITVLQEFNFKIVLGTEWTCSCDMVLAKSPIFETL